MKIHSTLIIAHRGESFDAPENTMAAINLAWDQGAEAVEIDIQLSSDKEIVVIHDFNTMRLAGMNKKVKNQSLDELKKLNVGSWKDIQWKDEKIPTLREVLDSVPDGRKLIIEIKSDSSIIPFLKTAVEQSGLRNEQIELIGFDLKTMAQAKKEMPENKVLWLLELDYTRINRIFKPSIKKAIAKVRKHQLDGLNVWAGEMLNQKTVELVHEAGLQLYCWTVNDVEKAKNLIAWGIDAITTDGAQWLSSHFMENQ
jgi:glycerophosphoryl diester phosphodiesterase